jgi:plastocyanin
MRVALAHGLLWASPVVIRLFMIVSAWWLALGAAPAVVDLHGESSVAGKALPGAVVWLEVSGIRRGPAAPAVLDQRNLTFEPHVLAVQVGTRVKFPNHDRVFHNVFSHHDGKIFDLGLYPVGAVKEVPFDRPGLSRVFCNIHPQMAAYVMVLETPFFAVSDRDGKFVIRGVPPGTYVYRAWRPGGAILSNSVSVHSDTRLNIEWP